MEERFTVQILERLDFLCFFHQVFFFASSSVRSWFQLAKGVIQTMDTVDGIFQGKSFRGGTLVFRQKCCKIFRLF